MGSRWPVLAPLRIREPVAEHRKPTLGLGTCGLVLHHVPVLREAPLLYPKEIDDNLCGSPTAAEAAVNHDVFAFRDGQATFVPPADRAHQRQEAVQSRSNPDTVLDILRRPVAFR